MFVFSSTVNTHTLYDEKFLRLRIINGSKREYFIKILHYMYLQFKNFVNGELQEKKKRRKIENFK